MHTAATFFCELARQNNGRHQRGSLDDDSQKNQRSGARNIYLVSVQGGPISNVEHDVLVNEIVLEVNNCVLFRTTQYSLILSITSTQTICHSPATTLSLSPPAILYILTTHSLTRCGMHTSQNNTGGLIHSCGLGVRCFAI